MVCDLYATGLSHLGSDKQQREYVAYQRAAAHLELSTHSAEQGACVRVCAARARAQSTNLPHH